jgi:hypothetical protein
LFDTQLIPTLRDLLRNCLLDLLITLHDQGLLQHGLGQVLAEVNQVCLLELLGEAGVSGKVAEGRTFKGETIGYVELSVYSQTGARLLVLIESKSARVVPEHLRAIPEQLWDEPYLQVLILMQRVVWPVNENVLFLAMLMNVPEGLDPVRVHRDSRG